jgi:hypothetical protein
MQEIIEKVSTIAKAARELVVALEAFAGRNDPKTLAAELAAMTRDAASRGTDATSR